MSKCALVTGASSGIGAAYAQLLASRGYDLVIHGRRREKLEAIAREIQTERPGDETGARPSVEIILGDLRDDSLVDRLLEAGNEKNINLLINNAGFGSSGSFANQAEPLAMLKVHAAAAVRLCHGLIPGMLARGAGGIINVSSIAGEQCLPGSVMYTATKSFLTRFTQSLALELWESPLIVQALLPGFTYSDFHDKMPEWEMEKRNKGLVRWHSAHYVAEYSLEKFDRGRSHVTVIPGFFNKLMATLPRILPPRLYYSLARKITA